MCDLLVFFSGRALSCRFTVKDIVAYGAVYVVDAPHRVRGKMMLYAFSHVRVFTVNSGQRSLFHKKKKVPEKRLVHSTYSTNQTMSKCIRL